MQLDVRYYKLNTIKRGNGGKDIADGKSKWTKGVEVDLGPCLKFGSDLLWGTTELPDFWRDPPVERMTYQTEIDYTCCPSGSGSATISDTLPPLDF